MNRPGDGARHGNPDQNRPELYDEEQGRHQDGEQRQALLVLHFLAEDGPQHGGGPRPDDQHVGLRFECERGKPAEFLIEHVDLRRKVAPAQLAKGRIGVLALAPFHQ